MKKIINILSILFLLTLHGFAQKDFDKNFDDEILKKAPNKPSLNSTLLKSQNQLETIEIVANSSGAITPQFIYKGVVDPDAVDLIVDPTAFTALINGNSMSSVSPDDNGQFYISQWSPSLIGISQMLDYINYAKSPMYELRFDTDDAGLAMDGSATRGIYKAPFTVWDINGTPGFPDDDIQMFIMTWSSSNADSSWGIRSGFPSDWTLNPAQRSDRIYIYYFKDGTTYVDFEAAYQTQVSTGIINPNLWNDFVGNYVLRRITINSLDSNPLTTINSLNGLTRPAPGTIIRWTISVNLSFNVENLYAVVGESFNYIPNVSGWPTPTLSAIQLPSWLNLNASGELSGTPAVSDGGWNYIGLQATSIQGTVEGWYDLWVDIFPWMTMDHNNNNIVFSAFNSGKVGTQLQNTGSGFQFNNMNGLYDGQFIIAKSDTQISGELYSDNDYSEFATQSPVSPITSPFNGFDQAFHAEFSDDRSYNPIGVRIIQNSYSKSTVPDDDYIILDYEIFNTTPAALNGIYVAIAMDWDIGYYADDLAGYDAGRQLSYIFESSGANNPNYYGIAVLMGNVSGNIFKVSEDDSIFFLQMTSFDADPTQAADYRPLISTGPHNIPAGGSVRVVFAILGGTDLTDIQANADAARTVNLIGLLPLTTTNAASNVTNNSAVLNATVNPNNFNTTVEFEYGTTTGYGNIITAIQSPISGISDVMVSANLTGLSETTTYHYRVTGTNIAGTSNGTDQSFVTSTGYSLTYNLNTTISFPSYVNASDYSATEYGIVGLPGASNLSVNALFSGKQNEDWQVYWDNGAPSNYLKEFDASTDFRFSTGRAFWIINKGPLTINETVDTAPLNADEEAEMPLHNGWNLITNPFSFPIDWSKIQQVNSISDPLWQWSATFNQTTSFGFFEGYYFFNATNLPILRIPINATIAKPIVQEDFHWKINIILYSEEIKDASLWFGVAEQADGELDELDFRKPRAFGPIPSVYFFRPQWDENYWIFATDFRPQIQDVEKWDFSVTGPLRQKMTITFSEIEEVPEQHEIYLLDEFRSVYLNLRDQSEYSFIPVTEISNFYILVGSRESVIDELDKVVPTEFELGKNFPNPFNPSTIIPVSLPEQSNISLRVYDILGKDIKTIFQGTKETGKYYFTWDGTNLANQKVAAGVYLYRLIVKEGNVFVGKMVLVK